MTIIKPQNDIILWWLLYKRRVIDKLSSSLIIDMSMLKRPGKKETIWSLATQLAARDFSHDVDKKVNEKPLKSQINKDYQVSQLSWMTLKEIFYFKANIKIKTRESKVSVWMQNHVWLHQMHRVNVLPILQHNRKEIKSKRIFSLSTLCDESSRGKYYFHQ